MEKYLMIQDGRVILIHNMPFDAAEGLHKSREDLLASGILVEEVPEPQQRDGFAAVLMHDKTNGLYYEYEVVPETQEEKAVQNAIDAYTLQLIEGRVL